MAHKDFGLDRAAVLAALERALRYRACTYAAVERILAAQAKPRSSMESLAIEAREQLVRILLGAGFLYAGLEKVFDFTGSGKPFTSADVKFTFERALRGNPPARWASCTR